MAFDIKLYTNLSEANRVTKDITLLSTINGSLRDGSTLTDPDILIEGDLTIFKNCNYIEIPQWNRFYFVSPPEMVRTGLIQIHCHVDALSSFAAGIKANKAIIERQTEYYNLYLNDGSLHVYQYPQVVTKEFPNGFTAKEFVLFVAGPQSV